MYASASTSKYPCNHIYGCSTRTNKCTQIIYTQRINIRKASMPPLSIYTQNEYRTKIIEGVFLPNK